MLLNFFRILEKVELQKVYEDMFFLGCLFRVLAARGHRGHVQEKNAFRVFND